MATRLGIMCVKFCLRRHRQEASPMTVLIVDKLLHHNYHHTTTQHSCLRKEERVHCHAAIMDDGLDLSLASLSVRNHHWCLMSKGLTVSMPSLTAILHRIVVSVGNMQVVRDDVYKELVKNLITPHFGLISEVSACMYAVVGNVLSLMSQYPFSSWQGGRNSIFLLPVVQASLVCRHCQQV